MNPPNSLHLYEELLLLALRNTEGTVAGTYVEHATAGALMAELLLDSHVAVDAGSKHMVRVVNPGLPNDLLLDACLTEISQSKKPASLQSWITRIAAWRGLREKIALQLCHRGILRADESKVLLIFTRKIYPEINPVPEQQIIERLREAIFSDDATVSPRTVVLISLANSIGLLAENLGAREIKSRKKRIEQIVKGEATGEATREIIAACDAAVAVAAVLPIIIACH